jgi:hypothetical protein
MPKEIVFSLLLFLDETLMLYGLEKKKDETLMFMVVDQLSFL